MSGDPITLCLAGEISPQVAVARLLLGGATATEIAAAVRAHPGHGPADRIATLARLVDGRDAALDRLATEIAASERDHAAMAKSGEMTRVTAFFDRAVAHSPEASVALYSLGDPSILAAATAEIVAWLQDASLLHPGADVLDLGCGIGRVAAAIAPFCRGVLGLDISSGMIAEATRRHALVPNLRFQTTQGSDLSALADARFDLVLAVDSFPYMMDAHGAAAERHIRDAARALRPGGTLAILNLSYRGDPEADRADAARWAQNYALCLVQSGTRPFELWDALAFVFRA